MAIAITLPFFSALVRFGFQPLRGLSEEEKLRLYQPVRRLVHRRNFFDG
jgi:hypothetical protein